MNPAKVHVNPKRKGCQSGRGGGEGVGRGAGLPSRMVHEIESS